MTVERDGLPPMTMIIAPEACGVRGYGSLPGDAQKLASRGVKSSGQPLIVHGNQRPFETALGHVEFF